MTLQCANACTHIICGYNPFGNNCPDSGTVYQQHRRFFITQRQYNNCLRKLFCEDLIAQLRKWQAEGDCLIVCLDTNKDIYKKSLGKVSTGASGLSMREVVGEFTGQKIGPTFFRGSKLIDGVWTMGDRETSYACIMLAGYRVKDHCMFIMDIVKSSLVGEILFHFQWLVSRQLNTKAPGSGAAKYIATLESSLTRHCLIKQLSRSHEWC